MAPELGQGVEVDPPPPLPPGSELSKTDIEHLLFHYLQERGLQHAWIKTKDLSQDNNLNAKHSQRIASFLKSHYGWSSGLSLVSVLGRSRSGNIVSWHIGTKQYASGSVIKIKRKH